MAASAYFDTIQKMYIAYFGRPADPIGLEFWAKKVDAAAGSLDAVISGFAASTESQALFGNKTSAEKVNAIYTYLFNRPAEPAGLTYWVQKLDSGEVSQAGAMYTILSNAGAGDVNAIANKLAVANEFTKALDTTAEILGYSGANAAEVARTYLQTVNSTEASKTAALAAVNTTVANVTAAGQGASGQTFTLTKSVQALTGTAGNDTFIAGDEGGSATLNAGDSITGGAGTDTLKLFNAAGALNAANFALATISGVENVEATLSATAQTLNVSGNADVKNVSLVNGFDGVVSLKLAQAAGLAGTIDTTGAAATFTFVDNAGGADTATLNLNNAALLNAAGAGNGVSIAGVETLNIAATGTNVLGSLNAAAATKLVVTGAGSVSTTLIGTATKTIDGSAATGNLTIDNSAAAAAVQSIKTGSGNDIYTTKAADLTGDDVIDLGAGTDSLRFIDNATFNSTATKANLAKVAGVEQLGVSGTGITLTVDGDYVSQTSYYVEGTTGKAVLTNVANNADITFGKTDVVTNATGVNTIGMKLGANTLNVNLTGAKDGAAVVGGLVATAGDGLAVTGSATINVKSTGTDGQPNNVLDLTAADNQSVVVTGSQNLTLTAKAATGTTGFSIDATAFTGKLTVTGTVAADIIKGGSGNDTINLANGDTATGNGGADKFIVDITPAGTAAADFTAVMASITDFASGTDTLKLSGTAATSANFTKATAAVADFTAALAAADTALNGTVQYNVQFVGNDAYVFFDADGTIATADTEVVKLVGVGLTGFAMTDIVAA